MRKKLFQSILTLSKSSGRVKMMRKLICALDSGVANMTNFFRVEKFPLFVVKFVIKIDNELRMNKVEKSISNITIILKK